MPKAYLTIDDGPSDKFESLVDFLSERQIPAVFFNRGDAMEANPDAVRYGIKKGYIMANHGYAHKRASQMSLREIQDDIVRAEKVLENIYWSCGEDRDGYYFRFPYMDRGMGPCFAEDINEEYPAAHVHLLSEGLGHVPAAPSKTMIEHKNKLQEFLRFMEFDALPVEGVTLPWFVKTQMGAAMDSLCTFSTSDWALM